MTARQFFRYFSLTLAVLFASTSLLTLTVRQTLLSSDLYTSALDQSGVYQVSSSIIETRVSTALTTLMKGLVVQLGIVENPDNQTLLQSMLVQGINLVIEQQTGQWIANVFENAGVDQLIQGAVETSIENDLAWLRGERTSTEIFEFIPTPEEVTQFQDSSLTEIIGGLTENSLGLNKLPTCDNSADETNALNALAQRDLSAINCTSGRIQPLISSALSEILPTRTLEEVGSDLEKQVQNSQIKPVVDQFFEISLVVAEFKQLALSLRSAVQVSYEASILLMVLSLPMLLIGLYLSPHKRSKSFFVSILALGSVLVTASVIYYLSITSFVSYYYLPVTKFDVFGQVLSPTESSALAQSLHSAVIFILQGIILNTFWVGLVIASVAVAGLFAIYLLFKYQLPSWLGQTLKNWAKKLDSQINRWVKKQNKKT